MTKRLGPLARALAGAAVVLTVFVVAPAASAASEAYVRESSPGFVRLFYYSDGASAASDVTITSPSFGSYVITDPGDTITPGDGCAATDAHRVTCTNAAIFKLVVDVGRGDDRVTIGTGTATIILAGPGADTVLGGSGVDEIDGDDSCISMGSTGTCLAVCPTETSCQIFRVPLAGTTANDVLDGRGGNDDLDGQYSGDVLVTGGWPDRDPALNILRGGEGNDKLRYGRMDGGAGSDEFGFGVLDYSSNLVPVNVSLDGVANDGVSGEGDNARESVYHVIGTDGTDSLVGGALDDILDGRGAPDNLLGQGGKDVLIEGGGNGDNVDGGPGIDTADYSGRSQHLDLSLDGAANDGASGEGDLITNVEKLVGGSAGDVLTGNADTYVPNTATGIVLGQWLDGGGGPDSLRDGGGARDVLVGGEGIDFANYTARSEPLTLSAEGGPPGYTTWSTGNLSLGGNDGAAGEEDFISNDVEQLGGGSGNDTLTTGAGANFLYGMGGNDVLDGGLGNDFFDGGAGSSDRVTYEARNSPVVANLGVGEGGETSQSERDAYLPGTENLTGGGASDVLTGDANANALNGGPGWGEDVLNGGAGDDLLNGGDGADTMDGGPGGDWFVDSGVPEQWWGRIVDTVTYEGRSNPVTVSFDGSARNDGEAGEGDVVDPDGWSIERVVGGSGDDVLTGADATGEILVGGPGSDVLSGLGGNDTLEGGTDNDSLAGGSGDDMLEGGFQDDEMWGGGGTDAVDYTGHEPPPCSGICPFDPRGRGVDVSLDDVANDGNLGNDSPFGWFRNPTPAADNVHSDVEIVIGSGGPDTLIDSESSARLQGMGGNDALRGGRGRNVLDGGDGDDVLDGGAGGDTFAGGNGRDTADYGSRAEDRVVVTLDGQANDGSLGTEGDNVQTDVEVVIGSGGPDALTGNDAANELRGGDGRDTLVGLGEADRLIGGSGIDSFDAGAGDDTVNSRDDTIESPSCGAGLDTVLADQLDEISLGKSECENVLFGPPVNTAPPVLSGSAAKGQTLTASTGSWNDASGATYAYEFLRCDALGGACASIAPFGAANTYRLTAADVGKTIRVRVKATNAEGSTTSPNSAQTAVVADDTTPPPVPTITSGPTGAVASTSASFTFSSAEAGVTFECKRDAEAFAACTSPKTYTALAQGGHTFSVRAKDAADNLSAAGTRTWTVDTIAPPQPTITAGPSGLTPSSSARFTFTNAEVGVTFECKLDAEAFAGCTSPTDYASLTEGEHAFAVRARDAAGNTSTPATRAWTVDTNVPPAPTITAGRSGFVSSLSATFSFADAEAGVSFECALDDQAFAPCSSPQGYTNLSQGAHTFSVRAKDAAGNVSSVATRGWTVDTVDPNTFLTALKPPLKTTSRTARFGFRANEPGARFQCKLDKGAWTACTSPRTYKNLKKGLHTFQVRAVDKAGNKDESPAKRTWRIT